jgi:flagellin
MRIEMQEDFVSKLTDSIDSGIGRLVDADMNEESTRLKALQTQQQLAIQSLSIANTNSENILSLFRQ